MMSYVLYIQACTRLSGTPMVCNHFKPADTVTGLKCCCIPHHRGRVLSCRILQPSVYALPRSLVQIQFSRSKPSVASQIRSPLFRASFSGTGSQAQGYTLETPCLHRCLSGPHARPGIACVVYIVCTIARDTLPSASSKRQLTTLRCTLRLRRRLQ